MAYNDCMSRKENYARTFLQKVGEALNVAGSFFVYIISSVYAWVADWKWKQIWWWVGLVLLVTSSLLIVLEIVAALLLLGDPFQFERLLAVFTGQQLFDYLSLGNYYIVVFGGIVMELLLYTVVMWIGLYLMKVQNLFTVRNTVALWIMFAMSSAMFMSGMYYSLPQLDSFFTTIHRERSCYFHDIHVQEYASYKEKDRGYQNQNPREELRTIFYNY